MRHMQEAKVGKQVRHTSCRGLRERLEVEEWLEHMCTYVHTFNIIIASYMPSPPR